MSLLLRSWQLFYPLKLLKTLGRCLLDLWWCFSRVLSGNLVYMAGSWGGRQDITGRAGPRGPRAVGFRTRVTSVPLRSGAAGRLGRP